MPELTRVERDRLDALKAKTPHPSAIPLAEGVRTEGEEIDFRRLDERWVGEERLAALRAQPERTRDELVEMEVLGAPAEEMRDLRRVLAVAEAQQDRERGIGEATMKAPRLPPGARVVPGADVQNRRRVATADDLQGEADAAGRHLALQREADAAASPAARQRVESERIARDADRAQDRERGIGEATRAPDGVQDRERADRGEVGRPTAGVQAAAPADGPAGETPEQRQARIFAAATGTFANQGATIVGGERGSQPSTPAHNPDGSPLTPAPAEAVTGSAANDAARQARADRLAALRARKTRTPEQDAELAGLEASAG